MNRLAGHPNDSSEASGRSAVRPWAGPIAVAALSLYEGRTCARLGVEAGEALLSAKALAGGALATATAGPWLGVSLAGGWRFE